jgi:hypothetical protein
MELVIAGTTEDEQLSGWSIGFDWVDTLERALITARVFIDENGTATIEFLSHGELWDPGGLAGTTNQLDAFLLPVVATLFEFPQITAVDVSRLCWGEMGCGAPPITREGFGTT